MAIVELTPPAVEQIVTNRVGYPLRLRTDLLTVTCVICQVTYDGPIIDVSPADNICVPCGSAIAAFLGKPTSFVVTPPRYEDIFPDDGVPALHDNDPVEVKPKRSRAKKAAKK